MHKILLEEEVAEEEEEGRILEEKWADISKEKCMIFIAYDAIEMEMMLPHVSCLGTKFRKEMKKRVKHLVKGKEKHSSPLIVLWYITTLE